MKKKVVILGCGRLGASVAAYCSSRGDSVIVVDSNPVAFDRLEEPFSGFKVTGDATDFSVLEREAFIATCDEAVITTGSDNVNLFLAHLCSGIYGVERIIVRFDDPAYETLVEGLRGVEAVYPFQLSYQEIVGKAS